jgi:hypothetical protein
VSIYLRVYESTGIVWGKDMKHLSNHYSMLSKLAGLSIYLSTYLVAITNIYIYGSMHLCVYASIESVQLISTATLDIHAKLRQIKYLSINQSNKYQCI